RRHGLAAGRRRGRRLPGGLRRPRLRALQPRRPVTRVRRLGSRPLDREDDRRSARRHRAGSRLDRGRIRRRVDTSSGSCTFISRSSARVIVGADRAKGRPVVTRKLLAALTFAALAGTGAAVWVATAGLSSGATYEPVLDPANFVSTIDNPYYPLPVGRTLVYDGSRDGQTQTDTIKVL